MFNLPKITAVPDADSDSFFQIGDESPFMQALVTLTDDGLRIRVNSFTQEGEPTELRIIDIDDETLDALDQLIDSLPEK